MYQFTTTTILNSNKDSNGTTDRYTGSAAGLTVTRVGTFKKANIVSVYKRAYQAGVLEIAHVTVPAITSGLVARLEVEVRLVQNQTDSEYANFSQFFKKPVVVEVLATGTPATDATALAAQINGMKDRWGFSYITASTNGADIILTAITSNQAFFSVKVLKEAGYTNNSLVEPKYEDVTGGTFHIATAGKVGFGDDEYMIKSIMLPTYENSRYFGTNKEERPIIGGNYSQYTLRYQVEKHIDDGIVSGGTAITTHVFYVKSDLVSGFEQELTDASLTFKVALTAAKSTLDVSDGDTGTTITATNAVGALAFVSATPTVVTVNATTGAVTLVGVGTSVITATDAVGNTGTVTITVQA
jgi:hypothetical protein